MFKSLNQFRRVQRGLMALKRLYLTRIWGMQIDPSVRMSLSATFDKTYPKGIHVGPETYIAFDVRVLTHDMTRNIRRDTRIGAKCFIGGRSLILPGVEIGDSCIVGAGSVVTKSVPPNTIVAGNPARVLRQDVTLLSYGRLPEADPVAAARLGLSVE